MQDIINPETLGLIVASLTLIISIIILRVTVRRKIKIEYLQCSKGGTETTLSVIIQYYTLSFRLHVKSQKTVYLGASSFFFKYHPLEKWRPKIPNGRKGKDYLALVEGKPYDISFDWEIDEFRNVKKIRIRESWIRQIYMNCFDKRKMRRDIEKTSMIKR